MRPILRRSLFGLLYSTTFAAVTTLAANGFAQLAPYFSPRAEDYARKYGMTEDQVKELTDGKATRVTEGPVADVLQSMSFGDSKFIIPFLPIRHADTPHGDALDSTPERCTVYLRNIENYSPKKELREEFARFIFKHELAHCGGEDEAEADYLALTEEPVPSAETVQLARDWRAAHKPSKDEHDTALYLEQRLGGVEDPDLNAIRRANHEAGEFLKVREQDREAAKAFLTPLAKKRLAMFVEARKRLMKPSS